MEMKALRYEWWSSRKKEKKTGGVSSLQRQASRKKGWEDRGTCDVQPTVAQTAWVRGITTTVSCITNGKCKTFISASTHLCTGKFAHHEMGVFKSVIVIIFTTGWGGTLGAVRTPAGATAVIFRVERIYHNRLCALNLTAAEGTSCPLTLRFL